MIPGFSDPKPMTCKCCGAPLTRGFDGWYCEYCGTKYIGGDTGQHTLKIVTEPARVEHLACQMAVPKAMIGYDADGIAKYAMRNLAEKMAEGLENLMRYKVEYNPITESYIVRSDIGVVIPRDRHGVIEWGNVYD